jgi:cytochrome c553
MYPRRLTRVAVVALLPALVSAAPKQATPHYVPRFEAVAETKLLMEALAHSNYRGLEGLLKKEPTDPEGWAFARGQALLIAETGNLLLLRPPKTPEGQDAWFQHATQLRQAAAALGRNASAQDYARSRSGLADVAEACNRCHRTFRIATRIGPASGEEGRP